MQNFIHPADMSPEQRREANASMQDRIANAMQRAGGISAKRDAPKAREMAKRIRESK